jgi:hypothetical protein
LVTDQSKAELEAKVKEELLTTLEKDIPLLLKEVDNQIEELQKKILDLESKVEKLALYKGDPGQVLTQVYQNKGPEERQLLLLA